MHSEEFVHLHLHSEFSLSDGIIKIEDLVAKSSEFNFPAVAITDLTNLFGLIKFYRLARENGVKPIVGSEIKLASNTDSSSAPLVLLVKNKTGYTNLTKIVSKAYVEGQSSGEPLVKFDWLEKYSDGLIALSGGLEGHIGKAIISGNLELSEERIEYFKKIFQEDFFIEVQRLGKPSEKLYNESVVNLAIKKGVPIVATNDVRFLSPSNPDDNLSDFEAHEARVCIQSGETLNDPRRKKDYVENQYFRSAKEMVEIFSDLPEAISNTLIIAEKCNLDLELGQFYLPDFKVPDGQTREDFLRDKSKKGLLERIDQISESNNCYPIDEKEYLERLEYELNMICKLDFAGYFLIVADFVNWAQVNNIPVGPGRGSGAGSIVAYSLGITAIDPMRYGLLFERFLNPERVSNPDFDIDFCVEGREKVLEYVTNKYGKDSVAQISTRGTMAARAALRDVVRVMDKPYGFGDRLAKAVPNILGITLAEAYEDKDFKEIIESEDESKEVFEMAVKLEGISRSVGTHAAGVVIAPTALTDFTPLILDTEKGTVASQFDMGDVESAGLVKFDFLGLKTLTILDQSVNRINKRINNKDYFINIEDLPLDDEKTFELLQKAQTTGVFQLESQGMKGYLKRLVPSVFEDVAAMNALYRPGPLGMGMVDSYIDRKNGKEDVIYGHEEVKNILKPTYGVIVYQEQVMQIAQRLSGFSLGQADILRRAMGKKKKEEMEKLRSTFVDGAVERDVDERYAANLFDQIEQFAGYGFNRSHSVGYALIAYQTAWLKAHYPSEFMSSVLSCELDSTDRIQLFVDDCRSIGLKVLKPDINKSLFFFEDIDSSSILYGLGAIKGIGESLVKVIVDARTETPFESLLDFCLRIGSNKVNKRILTALIGSGSMDALGERSQLFNQIEGVLKNAEQVAEREKSNISDLFGASDNFDDSSNEILILDQKIDLLAAEWNSLGFYLESHPINSKKKEVRKMCGFFLSELITDTRSQRIAGMIINLNVRQGKRGRFAFITLDDGTGRIEVSIWADIFDNYRSVLKKGQLIVVEGIVENDTFNSDSEANTYKMVAEHVLSFDQAREKYLKHIAITLDPEFLDVNIISNGIKSLSQNFDGIPVLISFLGTDAKADILLPSSHSMSSDDKSISQLQDLCGIENVDLVYHSLPFIN